MSASSESADRCLLLFVRFPQAGHTKTRLIPALGAAGAAQLQREMADYLLRQLVHPDWQLQVHFTGGSLGQMKAWLGEDLAYHEQGTGGLGDRIHAGFKTGFTVSSSGGSTAPSRIIVIGADCPDLSTAHIQKAFQQLTHSDMVLGPAKDGGYYLIGLRQPTESNRSFSKLFQDIDWSTSRVFQQTQHKAQQLGLSLSTLETLSDIDRPEDLILWERLKTPQASASSRY